MVTLAASSAASVVTVPWLVSRDVVGTGTAAAELCSAKDGVPEVCSGAHGPCRGHSGAARLQVH